MTDFTLYYIEGLNQYSNLLIAILTAATLFSSYYLLKSSQTALRLSALPIFFPKILISKEKNLLVLENYSDYPGYNIDLWVIGQYDQNINPYSSLIEKKYKKRIKIDFTRTLYPGDGYKSYSIVDRITHPTFPPKAKCTMDLNFQKSPDTFYLIVQFKDPVGHNYLFQSWLYTDNDVDNKMQDLVVGDFNYNFRPSKRLDYSGIFSWIHLLEILSGVFKVTGHISLPVRVLRLIPMCAEFGLYKIYNYVYLQKSIKDTLLRAIPAGYQKRDSNLSIDNRGHFEKI